MRTLSLLLMALPLTLAACGDDGGDGDAHPSLDLDGDAVAGADVYDSTCAGCHGADGTGGSGSDLTAVVPGQSREDLVLVLVNGIDGTSMVSYDDTLEDQEIADVVAYLLDEWGR